MYVNDSFYRTILDAIPIPVFVVDDDVQIRDLNAVAVNLIGLDFRGFYISRDSSIGGGAGIVRLATLSKTFRAGKRDEGCGFIPPCGGNGARERYC